MLGEFALGAEAFGVVEGDPPTPDYCQLQEDRLLGQILAGGDFRELVCLFAEDDERYRNLARAVGNSFDRATATGEQLEMVGSHVDLPRRGFSDPRYRDLIAIQIECLLSAEREDGTWVGTCENVLRITRLFIGEGDEPIFLQNEAPYDYNLTVPGLELDEAPVLVSFLQKARYAGVYGVIQAPLGDEWVWGHEDVAVDDNGLWGHEQLAVAGVLKWAADLAVS